MTGTVYNVLKHTRSAYNYNNKNMPTSAVDMLIERHRRYNAMNHHRYTTLPNNRVPTMNRTSDGDITMLKDFMGMDQEGRRLLLGGVELVLFRNYYQSNYCDSQTVLLLRFKEAALSYTIADNEWASTVRAYCRLIGGVESHIHSTFGTGITEDYFLIEFKKDVIGDLISFYKQIAGVR